MRVCQTLALLLITLLGPSAFASEDTAVRMGLPAPAPTSWELRIWIEGFFIPNFLYVIRSTPTGAFGERLAWVEFSHSDDPTTEAMNKKENRRFLKALRSDFCGYHVKKANDLAWCQVPLRTSPNWDALLKELDVQLLWLLRTQDDLGKPILPGGLTCTFFDGTTVGIELISDGRRHYAAYSNPGGGCCPWDECKIADRVLTMVKHIE